MCAISTRSGFPTGYGMGFQGNGNGASIPSRAGSIWPYINSYVSSRCLFQASIWPSEFPMNAMDKHVDLETWWKLCSQNSLGHVRSYTLTLNWSFEMLEVYTRPAKSSSFVIGKPSNLNGFSIWDTAGWFDLSFEDPNPKIVACRQRNAKEPSEPVSSFIVVHGGSLGLWGLWGDMALGHLAGSGLKLCGKKVKRGRGQWLSLAFIESLDRKCCTVSVDIMFQFGSLWCFLVVSGLVVCQNHIKGLAA